MANGFGVKLANDITLVTNSVEDIASLLEIFQQFSSSFDIHLNVAKYEITSYIYALQTIARKRDCDDTLRARLTHVPLSGCPIYALSQDDRLPDGYSGTSLAASLPP